MWPALLCVLKYQKSTLVQEMIFDKRRQVIFLCWSNIGIDLQHIHVCGSKPQWIIYVLHISSHYFTQWLSAKPFFEPVNFFIIIFVYVFYINNIIIKFDVYISKHVACSQYISLKKHLKLEPSKLNSILCKRHVS